MSKLDIWDKFNFSYSAILLVFLLFLIKGSLAGIKTKFNLRVFELEVLAASGENNNIMFNVLHFLIPFKWE